MSQQVPPQFRWWGQFNVADGQTAQWEIGPVDIQFSVWVKREEYLTLKNTIQEQIKVAFDEAGIEIPFPHRSLYAGSVTQPFPVRIVPQTGDADSLSSA